MCHSSLEEAWVMVIPTSSCYYCRSRFICDCTMCWQHRYRHAWAVRMLMCFVATSTFEHCAAIDFDACPPLLKNVETPSFFSCELVSGKSHPDTEVSGRNWLFKLKYILLSHSIECNFKTLTDSLKWNETKFWLHWTQLSLIGVYYRSVRFRDVWFAGVWFWKEDVLLIRHWRALREWVKKPIHGIWHTVILFHQ